MLDYFKSPMNYIGNKFKLLPQIIPLFPKDMDTFVDLFCGGLDVTLNVEAKKKICNDREDHIIDFYNALKGKTGDEVHNKIMEVVAQYDLSKTNQEGYLQLRADYNKEHTWYLFYSLIAYSFNNQLRFNNKNEFNMPFGKNKSCYNERLQSRLQGFVDRINKLGNNVTFLCSDFRDVDLSSLTEKSFLYADPPYLITTASYNEKNGWVEKDEEDLLSLLDELSERKIKFGLSNVIEQNGKINSILSKWSEKYNVIDLSYNYSNCNYHKKNRSTIDTREVFVCNYEVEESV